jgi:hypothetical protein
MTLLLAALLLAETTSLAPASLPVTEPDPKAMSQREIKDFNAAIPRDHPFYIRCVRSADIGSLVKRNFSCRTNRQWRMAEDRGNDEARVIGDEMASKSWNTN